MRELISEATIETIAEIELEIRRHVRHDGRWFFEVEPRLNASPSRKTVRARLLWLNELLAEFGVENRQERGDAPTEWLFYEIEVEVIPVYHEAVAVVEKHLIVEPHEIPRLLRFMGIPNTKTGVDPENHDNKGYHFHYGEVKKDALVRYDVLLTFNKSDTDKDGNPKQDIPLHVEPHGVGNYVHIDASLIGHSRRLPIYLVCEKVMRKRGLQYFLRPSRNSSQFYPLT